MKTHRNLRSVPDNYFIRLETGGRHPVLHVVRDIDIASASHLDEAIAFLAAEQVVIVDLDVCPYFDSTGIRVLLHHCKTLPIVILVQRATPIHRSLEVTGLLDILHVVDTIEDAHRAADELVRSLPAGPIVATALLPRRSILPLDYH